MSGPPKPRILIAGWAGAHNIGDELLTRAVVAMVRDAGGEPVIATRDPQATAALHRTRVVRWPGVWANVDAVCIGPGGIIQDDSSIWSLPAHLAPAVVNRGRPRIGLGLGADPLRRRSSRWLIRRALADQPVTVRDRQSANEMSAAGIGATIAADLAFSLPFVQQRPCKDLVVAVGADAVPGWLRPVSWRQASAATNVAEPAAALDRLSRRHGLRVVFVACRGERDRRHGAMIAAGMSQPCMQDMTFNVDAVVERITTAAALITSRYHAAVVALASGVPAVVVSEEPKLVSLVHDVDDPLRLRRVQEWPEIEITAGRVRPYQPNTQEASRRVVNDLVCVAAQSAARRHR